MIQRRERERERLNGGSEEREKNRRGAGREEDGVRETMAEKKNKREEARGGESAHDTHAH